MILGYIIPIALQQALVSLNFMLDNFMVGKIGSTEIAALASSNRFLFIIRFSIIAFAIGNAVLSAQYGKRDEKNLAKTLGVSIVTSIVFSLLYIFMYFLNRNFILDSFSSSNEISAAAGVYIDLAIFSSLTLSVLLSYITSLRSLGSLYIPLFSSIVSFVSNLILSYTFIFVLNYGLRGAAISTILSEAIAVIFIFTVAFIKYRYVVIESFKIRLTNFTKYLKISLVTLASHLVWSLHTMVMSNLFGHLSESSLTIYGLILPIEAILIDIFVAFGFTILIFVGNYLAENKNNEAYNFSLRMLVIGVIVGLISSYLLIISSESIVSFYNISESEAVIAVKMLKTLGSFLMIKLISAMLYSGILRAGGDMTYLLVLTTFLAWGLIVPVSYIGFYYFNWDIHQIYLAILSLEVITKILMLIRFKSRKWMNNLTN